MSNIWILVRADIRQALRRQLTMLALIVVFVSAVLVCQAVIGAGAEKFAATMRESSAMNLIEVSSTSQHSQRAVDADALDDIAAIPGVAAVYPWFQVDLALDDPHDLPDENIPLSSALWGTPLIPGLEPDIVLGAIPEGGLKQSDILLPRDVDGGTLDHLLGRTVRMAYTQVTGVGTGTAALRDFTVVGIFDNSVPGREGMTPSYVALETLTEINRAAGTGVRGVDVPFDIAYVKVSNLDDLSSVQQTLASNGFAVMSVASQLSELGGLFDVMEALTWIFRVILVLVCLGVGGAAGAIWVQQRTREIGLLKAIGWRRRSIVLTVGAELLVLGALAASGGLLLGVVLSLGTTAVIADAEVSMLPVAAWQVPPVGSMLVAFALVPICMLVGAARNIRAAANTDPDEALRDL
ncbi:ABC transporter permease [Sanguibacter sp. A247]|uniref:ABC transporter permease n=1 Tax=unclassified Sanguibacter TaxID=2645534 RepID=UPI003FD7D063